MFNSRPDAFYPFSKSPLWAMQNAYYQSAGVLAWTGGRLPHYGTNNAYAAGQIAAIVYAFARDYRAMSGSDEPITICELGAGSGRFGYQLIRQLEALCEGDGIDPHHFRLILTDYAAANVAFWRTHPRLKRYFADGRLDSAIFDVTAPAPLTLDGSGNTVHPGDLDAPVVVIANYVWDSIPPDLYRIENRTLRSVEVAFTLEKSIFEIDPTDLFSEVTAHLRYAPLDRPPYPDPLLNRVLEACAAQLTNTHLLFPAAALTALDSLFALSKHGGLALTADKGFTRPEALDERGAPALTGHGGAFSLNVNLYAFGVWCEARGGKALFADQADPRLNLSGLLVTPGAAEYRATDAAFRAAESGISLYGFSEMVEYAENAAAGMDFSTIESFLRFARGDVEQFTPFAERLAALIPALDTDDIKRLQRVLEWVAAADYPLGEDDALAGQVAALAARAEERLKSL